MPRNHSPRLAATRRRRARPEPLRTLTEITPLESEWFERYRRILGEIIVPANLIEAPLGSKALAEASRESARIALRRYWGGG